MSLFLRQIAAVAHTEWRILCRSRGLRWLFGQRYARALITRAQRRATYTVLACGLLLIASALPRFQSAVAATTLSGPVHQLDPAPVTVQNYNLSMTLGTIFIQMLQISVGRAFAVLSVG